MVVGDKMDKVWEAFDVVGNCVPRVCDLCDPTDPDLVEWVAAHVHLTSFQALLSSERSSHPA